MTRPAPFSPSRRALLGTAGTAAALTAAGPAAARNADDYGPLQPPDSNGLMLPAGFTSRIVAVGGETVTGTGFTWPILADGGATFATGDGGWIYVANSETVPGGVGALRFNANGDIDDAYAILTGTIGNCAGGATPWGTWLSCEEYFAGLAYECDPFNPSQGIARPALGTFQHEAAAVDPVRQTIYLTEDKSDGRLYRFTPSSYPDLTAGLLEVAVVAGGAPTQSGVVRNVSWLPLLNPNPPLGGSGAGSNPPEDRATRYQVPASTRFRGGEGAFYFEDTVYFTTKGDNQVWALNTAAQTIEIIYRAAEYSPPVLTGVDNVFVTPNGDVYVAEDGGNQQLVALTPSGGVIPILHAPAYSGGGGSSEIV
ncbi:MAG: PhoX family protein, partial [Gammaproteobacteria bacterium]|nr:PhoX family protein [Gammaproteobacteria bacterium]